MDPILDQFKERIRGKISELNYNAWFKPILDVSVKDDAFVMKVPNKFFADWITDYYGDIVRKEVFDLTHSNLRLGFEVSPDAEGRDIAEAFQTPVFRPRSADAFNPKYSFDRFVVGSSNQFAHAACKAVADLPGSHYNPLFLYGGVGLGKTHLLNAIGISLAQSRPEVNSIYVSGEKFMNELIYSLRCERMPEFRKKYRDRCTILLIDDIQFIGGKDRTQDEFFHTFDFLHNSHRQIVLTSDRPPNELLGIEERLKSRFAWGLTADIGPPDLETRIAILQKKAEVSNMKCPDDVAMFLASSIKSNVRELEGSLIRINAFASLTGVTVTIDLAREVLRDVLREREPCCTVESIQRVVADFYKLSVQDLKSPKRLKTLAHPRQVAMYLCKKHVRSSFPEIGNKFGGKDHTTVIHACRKIGRLAETDPVLQQDIATLEKNILH